MTKQFKDLPAVIMTDDFGKLKDDGKPSGCMWVTGEVNWACTYHKSKSYDGKYFVTVALSKEDYAQLNSFKTEDGRKLTGLKVVKSTKKDEDGNDVYDDLGDPVKEVSGMQYTAYQNGEIKGEVVQLQVVMAEDTNKKHESFIPRGSKVAILCTPYHTTFRDKPALGCNLSKVVIYELGETSGGEGSSGGSTNSAFDLLGLTPPEKTNEASPEAAVENKTKQNTDKGESEKDSSPEFDFDDEIPFD